MELRKENEYKDAMERINNLMAKGCDNVTEDELSEIKELANAAQAWEQEKFKHDLQKS